MGGPGGHRRRRSRGISGCGVPGIPFTRIIGIGNEHRRDDGVGIWVARQIAAAEWRGVAVTTLNAGDGAALLSAWQGARSAYLVDAVSAEARPGTILRIDARRSPTIDRRRFLSSHGLGVIEAVELGRVLGMLPDRIVIYGIVGRSFEHGSELSTDVAQAARQVIGRLRRVAWKESRADARAIHDEGVGAPG